MRFNVTTKPATGGCTTTISAGSCCLEGIISQLLAQVPRHCRIGREQVRGVLTAADGSVIETLASLAEAAHLRAVGSSYVGRIRDKSNSSDVIEERPVSPAAKDAPCP